MNLSSKPREYPNQFRRCEKCDATLICEPHPSTALPCKCGGELLVTPVATADIMAERQKHADALNRLADKCESNAGADGMVLATGAARHMRALAAWMLTGEVAT